eukprot:scaffold179518_cov26-Tisochrysis_lutea.AAC.1
MKHDVKEWGMRHEWGMRDAGCGREVAKFLENWDGPSIGPEGNDEEGGMPAVGPKSRSVERGP